MKLEIISNPNTTELKSEYDDFAGKHDVVTANGTYNGNTYLIFAFYKDKKNVRHKTARGQGEDNSKPTRRRKSKKDGAKSD